LYRGADIQAANDNVLCFEAQQGNLDTDHWLLDQGADIHAHNEAAVGIAAKNGHLDCPPTARPGSKQCP
jgi:hypothetical protein